MKWKALLIIFIGSLLSIGEAKTNEFKLSVEQVQKNDLRFMVPSLWYVNEQGELLFYGIGEYVASNFKKYIADDNYQGSQGDDTIGYSNGNLEEGKKELEKLLSSIEWERDAHNKKKLLISLVVSDIAMPCPPCESHLASVKGLLPNIKDTASILVKIHK